MDWHKQLHWRIIIGLVLGLVYGLMSVKMGWDQFTEDWINPWGVIFMNLLKLIAVPLVLASLIVGVSSLSDIKQLSRIGGKTIGIYICTTLAALIIGVTVANVLAPGKRMPDAELFFAHRNDCSQLATPTAEQSWRCVTAVYHRQIIHEPLPLKPMPLSDLNLTPCFALFPTPFAARAFFFLA